MDKIKGTGVALVTPFNSNNSIDYIGLEKLINHVIDGGVDYLVVLGTTGESATLSSSEKADVIEFCKKINNNRLPIVLGIGGNNTLKVIAQLNEYNLNGIDAILSVSPSYNKPSQEGIINHYSLISKSCRLPIILYNVPSRTSSNISAHTVLHLASNFENIIGIKEASGNLDQIMQIIKKKPKDFIVISGDDSLTLPMIYLGAQGVISVIGQVLPRVVSKMVKFGISSNVSAANKLHYSIYDIYGPLYDEGNPVGVKACLEILDICHSFVRPPLIQASSSIKMNLIKLISK
ncbi:MAG: 4-hydroxy-tetrahydrodipicolinate synthase [Flavobacteriales bacterium]|nr:4-hydroxy-tetrahydrodipicolinate synthase [Flavobacteriales bacterium]|tara:strand:+ start:471 stop:1343 length:873 start_codon:yes stop_codon:yes gene_type:complete